MKGWTFAALAAAVLVLAAPASAVTTIPGTPLNVYLGDQGQLQAKRAGEDGGIFFPSDSLIGDAGFFLAFPPVSGQNGTLSGHVFGFDGFAGPDGLSQYTPVSQGPVSGNGSVPSPYTQETKYTVSSVATVKQTTTYVNGAQDFRVRWDVTNDSGQPLKFKALTAADFYFEGSDAGSGIFTAGPPHFVGGTNGNTGRSGGFVEVSPWDHWQALTYAGDFGGPAVWADVVENAAASSLKSFDDSIETRMADNAGGVEWDDTLLTPLASGATKTYELLVRSAVPKGLQFDRSGVTVPVGTPVTFTVTAKDTSDQPFTGKQLRYSITGANAGSGAVTIDGNGNAGITDAGTHAGNDTIAAFLDLDGNGVRGTAEPQAVAAAAFAAPVDHTPPSCSLSIGSGRPSASKPLAASISCTRAANLVVSGTFTIKLPKKKGKAAKTVTAKAARKAAQVLLPGKAVPLAIKVPSSFAKKYANAKVTATVDVTATDVAGNKGARSATRAVRLAALKKKKHRR